ncbi:CvpA family protein [Flavobacterium restrictum]|uniref:CvpA family protein n=1 Tax=Flavobacterium restrictum TaxID=2594428 RepID=A0A553E3B7_9FLAO|nr:CvpA family protein [Flavobacterium restrictum]TRX39460.1 CvpA family protein [Flavobacterium restrictum]
MSFLDIVLGGILVYALYKGIRNGLFVELASLLSLLLGIYFAIKFSSIIRNILTGFVHWNPNSIQIVAFVLTFVLVVLGIQLLGKFLTGIADFAYLGWVNSLGGGFFRVLKAILIISVFLTLFQKINYHNYLAKKETLDHSLFYNPIQKVAGYLFPSIEKWYDTMKK